MNVISFICLLFFINLASAVDTSGLCLSSEQNQISFSRHIQPRQGSELTVITWNAYKFAKAQFFKDYNRLAEGADVLLVQEAMHTTRLQNDFAETLPFDFSFHKSFCNSQNRATGVMNSARAELFNFLTFVSPDLEPLARTPKVSAYSQIIFNGKVIHLINTHALNFNTGSDFERQIYQIGKFISELSGPIIWAGDFNTWNADRRNYMKKLASTLQLTHLIPSKDPRTLILDHIYVKGFTALTIEVLPEKSSDHRPLKAVLRLL